MTNPLHALFALGLSMELYDFEVTFWKLGPGSRLHGQTTCDTVPPKAATPKRRPRNLTGDLDLCECWEAALTAATGSRAALARSEYWFAQRLLQDEKRHMEQSWSARPGLALLELRRLRAHFQDTRDEHTALTAWCDRVLPRLDTLIGHIQRHCRSEEIRDELTEHWTYRRNPVSAERTLILAQSRFFPERQSHLATALCSWMFTWRGTIAFLDAPAWLVTALDNAGQRAVGHTALSESDTPAILETVAALWSENPRDELHDLGKALEAARTI